MSDDLVVGPAEISGNGCVFDVRRGDDSWQVAFGSEPRTSPQPLWFHIEAHGLGGAPVEFIWENPDICLGNRNELGLLRPVLRADEADWTRCDGVVVEEHDDGRRSVRFTHPGGAATVAAAFCFPYAPEHLDGTLAELGEAWERVAIGVTREGRPLERLRLRSEITGRRAGIYLMARQHSGETPGSWILDGMLRFLASDSDEAPELREGLDVWVCPVRRSRWGRQRRLRERRTAVGLQPRLGEHADATGRPRHPARPSPLPGAHGPPAGHRLPRSGAQHAGGLRATAARRTA
jgi:hypothetical protein